MADRVLLTTKTFENFDTKFRESVFDRKAPYGYLGNTKITEEQANNASFSCLNATVKDPNKDVKNFMLATASDIDSLFVSSVAPVSQDCVIVGNLIFRTQIEDSRYGTYNGPYTWEQAMENYNSNYSLIKLEYKINTQSGKSFTKKVNGRLITLDEWNSVVRNYADNAGAYYWLGTKKDSTSSYTINPQNGLGAANFSATTNIRLCATIDEL